MATEPTPPTLEVETGTPPRQWSESVLGPHPTKNTPATSSEMPARAGDPDRTAEKSREEPQVPGGFEIQQVQPSTSQESKPATTTSNPPSVGDTVVQTAKQYVPEKTVQYTTQTAAAAASYLPIPRGIKDTVASYLSPEENKEGSHVSMPSTELKGARPSERTGGVGALPGNLSESSVALLPDERQERAQERLPPSSLRQRRDTIKPSTAGGDNETQTAEETRIPRGAAAFKDETIASQQSDSPARDTEARAAEPVKGNTAARSGPEAESQEETSETRSREAASKQEKTEGVAAATGTVGTALSAPDTGEPSEKKKDMEGSNTGSEKLGQGKGPSQDVQGGGNKEGQTTATGKVEGGYGGEYHPAQLHPPPPGASADEHQTSVGAQQQGEDLPTTKAGKRASVGTASEKKPGLITMVKGEMKILAGKMSGNEHKVEEGKKIVHGGA